MTETKSKHPVRALAVVLALMGLTAAALAFTVDVALSDEPGVTTVLPVQLGEWTGHELRFCHNEACEQREHELGELTLDPTRCPACGSPLFTMSKAEYDVLPKDTVFVKSRYVNASGDMVFVSIVLSGRERNSIHRPQRCLVGQGHEIRRSRTLDVPLPAGGATKAMVLDCAKSVRLQEGPLEYKSYYAYWFVGNGRETPYHLSRMFWLAWDRVVHSVAHKWAYVSVSGRRDTEGDEYLDRIRDFTGQLHDHIVL